MTKDRAQQHLDSILDWLDFEKIHKTMEALDWRWVSVQGVPDIQKLRQTVRELFWDAYKMKGDEGHTGTGGFEVSVYKSEDYATCKFVCSGWETCDDV